MYVLIIKLEQFQPFLYILTYLLPIKQAALISLSSSGSQITLTLICLMSSTSALHKTLFLCKPCPPLCASVWLVVFLFVCVGCFLFFGFFACFCFYYVFTLTDLSALSNLLISLSVKFSFQIIQLSVRVYSYSSSFHSTSLLNSSCLFPYYVHVFL